MTREHLPLATGAMRKLVKGTGQDGQYRQSAQKLQCAGCICMCVCVCACKGPGRAKGWRELEMPALGVADSWYGLALGHGPIESHQQASGSTGPTVMPTREKGSWVLAQDHSDEAGWRVPLLFQAHGSCLGDGTRGTGGGLSLDSCSFPGKPGGQPTGEHLRQQCVRPSPSPAIISE